MASAGQRTKPSPTTLSKGHDALRGRLVQPPGEVAEQLRAVPVAVGAAGLVRVMLVPVIVAIFVPAGIWGPLMPMPTTRPVAVFTVPLVAPAEIVKVLLNAAP